LFFFEVFTEFGDLRGIGNSPRSSSSLHQVLEIHQVFTKFSPVFYIFHQALTINQEVSESHQVFTAVMVGM
jgi:hypothetical protein